MGLLVAQVRGNIGGHVAILFCTTHHEKRYKGMRVSAPGPGSSRFLWLHKGWWVRFRSVPAPELTSDAGHMHSPSRKSLGEGCILPGESGPVPGEELLERKEGSS